MRAWQVHRNAAPREALRLTDVDEPTPGAGELRLRVHAAAIGRPDAFLCHGTYAFRPELPFVAGQEVCGTVDAVGEGVDPALVGSRLMVVTNFYDGRGGFAEATIARADTAYRVPDDMGDAEAAAFRIGYSTAWIGLVRRGHLEPGERLLVLGAAGGSGAAAVSLGRALGAEVLAVVSGPEKAELCRRLGAHTVIDRTTHDVPAAALDTTGGAGVDVVYDPVGGPAADATVRGLAPGGRLLAVGFASGAWVRPDTAELVRRNVSLVGVFAGGLPRAENEADHEALLALRADGRLRDATTAVAFDDLPDALETVDAGEAVGKLVLRFPEPC
ncbi:NADPH:quinone oxidoreductase family protein [Rhabdothermincola salaria]|uniref:NADPH:quinone oxidoreductase family protein n=1 Tax=Rhabdothermincola salaria TaxID=2903142 RepID=UPI001E39E7CC|nr:NADPH:quinone oxidoreductase family protein [Rhabdothermincola salaria]MCD9625620.1 NADPH:quinone oxidoreductase family protein [Rhabdothermincola salaria]